MTAENAPNVEIVPNAEKPCRHEFVRIYQRKLKGLERRLVATKAYLPVGFKMADFGHLSEGSYCFCSKCRARLYPKRTNADRAAARLALAAGKQAQLEADLLLEEGGERGEGGEEMMPATKDVSISVEEMEVESVELADLEEGSVDLPEDNCQLMSDD